MKGMIKKIFGTLVALASVAVLVCTVLHRDRYASLLFSAEEPAVSAEPADTVEPAAPAAPAVSEPQA